MSRPSTSASAGPSKSPLRKSNAAMRRCMRRPKGVWAGSRDRCPKPRPRSRPGSRPRRFNSSLRPGSGPCAPRQRSGLMTTAWNKPGEGNAMKKLAFIFPGQGSQKVGMGKDFTEHSSLAKELFARADDFLGFKISEVCFEGPEDKLRLTAYTQPALLAVSYIAFRLLGIEPRLAAGHTLGEYSALVFAGSLAFEDALRLLQKWGQYIQEAVPVGVGGMGAILGTPIADIG